MARVASSGSDPVPHAITGMINSFCGKSPDDFSNVVCDIAQNNIQPWVDPESCQRLPGAFDLIEACAVGHSYPCRLADLSSKRAYNKNFHVILMRYLWRAIRFDDFGHGDTETGVVYHDHFTACHQPIVYVDVNCLPETAIEFHDAPPQFQKLTHLHGGFAENRADGNRYVIYGVQVTSSAAGGDFVWS